MLALAGVKRLNMVDLIKKSEIIAANRMLPAVAQGAIGIQCRDDDLPMIELLQRFNEPMTHAAVVCERSFLAALDGNCRTPIACQARYLPSDHIEASKTNLSYDRMQVTGLIAKPNGEDMLKIALESPLPNNIRNRHIDIHAEKELYEHAYSVGQQLGGLLKKDIIGEKKFKEYQDSFV